MTYRVSVRNLTKILSRVYAHAVEIRHTAITDGDAAAFYAPYIPLTMTGVKAGPINLAPVKGRRTVPGGSSLSYPASQIIRTTGPRPASEILAQLREMVEWCQERHGPSAVGSEMTGRQRQFDPGMTWGLGHARGKNAVFYFRDPDAAFEFKIRWI